MVNGISESIMAYSCNFQHEAIYVATKVKKPGWQFEAVQPKSLQVPLTYPRNSNNYATTHCIGATDKRRWRTFVLPLPAVDIFSFWKNLAPVRTVTALSSKRSAPLSCSRSRSSSRSSSPSSRAQVSAAARRHNSPEDSSTNRMYLYCRLDTFATRQIAL